MPLVDLVEVEEVLGSRRTALEAGLLAELGIGVDLYLFQGLIGLVVVGLGHDEDLGAGGIGVLDVSVVLFADGIQTVQQVLLGVVEDVVLTVHAVHTHTGLAVVERDALLQVGILVSGNDTGDLLQLQALVTQSVLLAVGIEGLLGVAERISIEVDLGDDDGTEQQLGDYLTGSGLTQHSAGDVLADAALIGDAGGTNLPVAAGELAVLVVAHSTQDHGQGFVTGHGSLGVKDLVAAALDVAGVGAVVDVPGIPGAVQHVSELAVGGVDGRLGILHIAGGDTIDNGGHFRTGDVALGLEGRAVVVTLEHFQTIEHGDGVFVGIADVAVIREGAGGGYEREAHDQRQHQCENLLQISHGGFFLLVIFSGPENCFLSEKLLFLQQNGKYQSPEAKYAAPESVAGQGV